MDFCSLSERQILSDFIQAQMQVRVELYHPSVTRYFNDKGEITLYLVSYIVRRNYVVQPQNRLSIRVKYHYASAFMVLLLIEYDFPR